MQSAQSPATLSQMSTCVLIWTVHLGTTMRRPQVSAYSETASVATPRTGQVTRDHDQTALSRRRLQARVVIARDGRHR